MHIIKATSRILIFIAAIIAPFMVVAQKPAFAITSTHWTDCDDGYPMCHDERAPGLRCRPPGRLDHRESA
jgi:hypothetical protein